MIRPNIWSKNDRFNFWPLEFANGQLTVGELVWQSAKEITVRSYASGEERTKPISDVANYDVIVETKRSQKNRARRLKRA